MAHGNALISSVVYLVRFFCPVGLAALYPRLDPDLPWWQVSRGLCGSRGDHHGCTSFPAEAPIPVGRVAVVSRDAAAGDRAGAVRGSGRGRPLHVPATDRVSALPWRGVWRSACRSSPYRCRVCAFVSALVLALVTGCAWRQTSFWCDSETLLVRTLACTSQNSVAENNLGSALTRRGRTNEAVAHYREALKINDRYAEAHYNLGVALLQNGRPDDAIAEWQKAVEIDHKYAEAYYNLGLTLARRGRFDDAMALFRKALENKPDYVEAYTSLGVVLADRGLLKEAVASYRKALKIDPSCARAHYNFGNALAGQNLLHEAMAEWQMAVNIQPNYADANYNLGQGSMRQGRIDEAIGYYRKALTAAPRTPESSTICASPWRLATDSESRTVSLPRPPHRNPDSKFRPCARRQSSVRSETRANGAQCRPRRRRPENRITRTKGPQDVPKSPPCSLL